MELQNNQPLTQQSDWRPLCCLHPCQPTGQGGRVSSAGCVPSSPPASTPFHFHFKGQASAGTCPERRRPVQQLVAPRPVIGFAVLQSRHSHWLCTVWLCFDCILTLYYGCLFVCKDIFHSETTSTCLTTTTNLKRF